MLYIEFTLILFSIYHTCLQEAQKFQRSKTHCKFFGSLKFAMQPSISHPLNARCTQYFEDFELNIMYHPLCIHTGAIFIASYTITLLFLTFTLAYCYVKEVRLITFCNAWHIAKQQSHTHVCVTNNLPESVFLMMMIK